eukprot:s3467_g6.t1
MSTTWANLLRLAARHHVLPDAPAGRSMPRPLRDADRVLGRRYLRPRELRQLEQGTLFFFQALISLGWSLVTGAIYIDEHPAVPLLQEAASVWKTPWVRLLCMRPEVVLRTVGRVHQQHLLDFEFSVVAGRERCEVAGKKAGCFLVTTDHSLQFVDTLWCCTFRCKRSSTRVH